MGVPVMHVVCSCQICVQINIQIEYAGDIWLAIATDICYLSTFFFVTHFRMIIFEDKLSS